MRMSSITPMTVLAALVLFGSVNCTAQTTTVSKPLYEPAAGTDRTKVRVVNSNRGPSQQGLPLVFVFAPDHAGTTISDQPELYWYLSANTKMAVDISLVEVGSDTMLYEFSIDGATEGFHSLDLAKENVRLEVNKRYELNVKLVVNPKNHAQDISSSGYIKRIQAPGALAAGKDAFGTLLGSGIWYDGVADLMKQLESKKDDADLKAARDTLLKQVGLADIVTKPAGKVQTHP